MNDNSDSKLRQVLRERNPQLAADLDSMIANVEPLLSRTLATFPTGTSHTKDHTNTVERIAGMLLTPQLISELNDDELQMLILACHFHDLGMAGTETDNIDSASQEQVRRDHAIRIGKIIDEEWRALRFRSHVEAQVLGEICRGHRPVRIGGSATWEEIHSVGVLGPDRSVRLRTISALIYAADELHIGEDRAPVREEEWIKLANDESRRHWKRHQQIRGPVVIQGRLHFEIASKSLICEEDLRRNVLRKALRALDEANRQLGDDGIQERLPEISLQWNWGDLMKQLLLRATCNAVPRTVADIKDDIIARFCEAQKRWEQLGEHCSTDANHEEIERQADRTIGDFLKFGALVSSADNPELVHLSIDLQPGRDIFKAARSVDSYDALFGGEFSANNEFDLFRSEWGREFVFKSLEPIVKVGFGITLKNESKNSPLLAVLRACPSASRLLFDFTPAPSLLVKRHLLNQIVVTGASFDLLRVPELILDRELRSSLRALMTNIGREQPEFVRLVEELALLQGFTFEQVHDAMRPSKAAVREIEDMLQYEKEIKDFSPGQITISQSVPSQVPTATMSFPYFVLAGRRAGVVVELRNSKEAPISVIIKTENAKHDGEKEIATIAFSPSESSFMGTVDMPAQINVNNARDVEIVLFPHGTQPSRECPIICHHRIPTADGMAGSVRLGWSCNVPAVTVGLVRTLRNAVASLGDEPVTCNLVTGETGMGVGTCRLAKNEVMSLLECPFEDGVINVLSEIDPDVPLPFCVPRDVLTLLAEVESAKNIYDDYKGRSLEERDRVTSITIRCTIRGVLFRQEWVGFFPEVVFNAPVIQEKEGVTQELVDQMWDDPQQAASLDSVSAKDMNQLMDEVLKWAQDPSQTFPWTQDASEPPTPVAKSWGTITKEPVIDRVWYVEQPIVITVRPLGELERWRYEVEYWEAIGDDLRAQLLRERLEEEMQGSEGE